jgi:hypothetical protein
MSVDAPSIRADTTANDRLVQIVVDDVSLDGDLDDFRSA